MSAFFERSVIDEYPAGIVIIPGDLSADDCMQYTTFQALVLAVHSGPDSGVKHPTTIVGGLAYTEATVAELQQICAIV